MRFRHILVACLLGAPVATGGLSAQSISSAVNAADYSSDIAPGSLISVFGAGLAPNQIGAPGLPLPAALGGTSVQVSDGVTTTTLPLYFVSPGQINAQVPYGVTGSLNLTVKTSTGASPSVAIKIVATAPKFFTISEAGSGFIVATHSDYSLVSRTSPAVPGETLVLFLNSAGAVAPPVAAGAAPGDGSSANPSNRISAPVSIQLDGLTSTTTYAGLAPGYPGLYQVNFTTPYDDKLGDASIAVLAGAGATQSGVTIPVRANGLFFAVTAGKFVNGQAFNGSPGANSSLAFRHNNAQTFGNDGLNAWSKNTGLGSSFSLAAGLALTLRSGATILYDNNGIESGTSGSYYASSPGTAVLFSMSNLSSPTSPSNPLRGVYAGYFKLSAATPVSQMIGYFEGALNVNPPFNPASMYNTFRMNLFSNVSGSPKETGSFTGDVFTSDTAGGAFTFGYTGLDRVTSDGTHIPIFRLTYTLSTPISLPAGEYWFSQDVATPQTSATGKSSVDGTSGNSLVKPFRPQGNVKE